MRNFTTWWQNTPAQHRPLLTVLCATLIFTAGIDLGRLLYHLLNG